MIAKACLERNVTNAETLKTTSKVLKQKMDIKQFLKLLESGKPQLADVDAIVEEFFSKPNLGDHIQYELHKYCQRDIAQPNIVIKLSELCYSFLSVSTFCNIDRFVGCAYYICSFLLKKGQFNAALSIVKSLTIKKDEILKSSMEKSDIRTFLSNFHSSFIASAISLASSLKTQKDENYKVSHNLAMESLAVFRLMHSEHVEIGKKVLKTATLYLQTIKYYADKDIFEFYKILNEVLKVLLPGLGNDYFCFYYLNKVNQSKKLDSEEEVHAMLTKTTHFLSLFLNSSEDVKNSLDKILEFFFSGYCESDWVNSDDLEVLSVRQSCSQLHFLLFSSIFSYGIQFLWKKFEKNWCENVSSEMVKNLSDSLLHFHRSHFRTKAFYCNSGKGPFESCFGDLLTGNLQKIQYTVRLCLKHKVPGALSLVSVSRDAFRLSMECLDYMESRGCCQEQRVYSWKYSVIHHTNTVEDICRHPPSEETWFFLKECSQEVLREVTRSETELPFDFKRINILFQRWHTASMKLKNYRDALYACVVYYVFYPKEDKDITSFWLQTKSESRNEIIEEMTMSEILRTCDGSLREFSPSYDSSKINMKSVLLMELKAYSTCPPDVFQNPSTTYHLATRIYKQLEKMSPDLWDTSFALCALIAANVAGDNEELPSAVHKKCTNLVDELINRKGGTHSRSLLHAANLTFSLFLYNVNLAEKSEGKVDTSHMVLGYLKKAEEEKVKFGEDVDLNLTCDVIPSSSHLTVALETNYLNELHKIVDMWSAALRNEFEELPPPLEFDSWQRSVKQVAHLYQLFGEYRRAFTTWLMFYRIGKLSGEPAAILLGLSHIVGNCSDVDESGVKEEAELVSGQLGSDASDKHVLVEYTLAVAANYLKNKKADKCLEYLTVAKKILEGLRTTVMTCALNAKFWCLVNKFLVLYKEYEAVFEYPPGTDVRVMAFKAFSYANGAGRSDLIKTAAQSECMELVLTMLEVNLWAYYLHGVYRQTDFMRFFLDDLYQIVQKLFLPTRTAEILLRLAEVDVTCEKVEDCQRKIAKLKSILTTLPSGCSESFKCENPSSPYLSVPEGGDTDVPSRRPISPARFLDKGPPPKELDSSPFQLYLDDMKSSGGSEHVKKCKCRLCQNLLIQTLTLSTVWLEAEAFNLNDSSKQAAQCYSRGYDMLNKLKLLRAEQSKILRVELAAVLKEVPGELDFQLAALQFHSARFLMRYALFESSRLKSVTENVMKIMLRVAKLMKTFSYEEKLLEWAFAELKLYCLGLNKEDSRPPRKITPVKFKEATLAKTPSVGVSSTAAKTNENIPVKVTKALDPDAKPKPYQDANDAMNNAFLGTHKVYTLRRVIRPQKLSFGTEDPDTDVRTVRKVQREKAGAIQSRKLDFDTSEDLFGETASREQVPARQRKTSRASRNVGPGPSRPRKEAVSDPVRVRADSKESSKRKRAPTSVR